MIICDSSKCTGCGLCTAVCPVSAIEMREDEQGFAHPVIDEQKCVNCGLCSKKCIANSHSMNKEIMQVYAACLNKTEELNEVSSGGVAFALMQAFIDRGAVVYGAVQKDVTHVCHCRAEKLEDIMPMRRSKYLQSDMTQCLPMIKNDIEQGREVLFTGVPCQVAAVKNLVGQNDRLFTVEIICHGVPSNLVFKKYISEIEKNSGSRVKELVFRHKSHGWGDNHYGIFLENGTVLEERSTKNAFHSMYLDGIISRESCGECQFSHCPRTADIALADYWRYQGELTEKSKGMGISLVVCCSDKAPKMIEAAEKYLIVESSDIELAKASCRHLDNSPRVSRFRNAFMKDIVTKGFFGARGRYIIPGNSPVAVVKKVFREIRLHENR